MKVHLRENCYYIRRRRPVRFKHIEPRQEIWISLSTDSFETATAKAAGVWEKIILSWEDRLAGNFGGLGRAIPSRL